MLQTRTESIAILHWPRTRTSNYDPLRIGRFVREVYETLSKRSSHFPEATAKGVDDPPHQRPFWSR